MSKKPCASSNIFWRNLGQVPPLIFIGEHSRFRRAPAIKLRARVIVLKLFGSVTSNRGLLVVDFWLVCIEEAHPMFLPLRTEKADGRYGERAKGR